MVRHDHYSHHDDPFNYFRRLESYSSHRPRSFSRPNTGEFSSGPPSVSPVRPVSHARCQSQPYLDSHVHSDVDSRQDSFATLQDGSYTDVDSLSYGSEKSPSKERTWSSRQTRSFTNPRARWSTRRKIVLSLCLAVFAGIAIIVGVVAYVREKAFQYTPSYAHVTNQAAFESGGASLKNPNDTSDGLSSGQDSYVYYSGGPENFPLSSSWISFEAMWQSNVQGIQNSCEGLGYGSDDSSSEIQDIYSSIQNRANVSLVDHRFILAIILQESHGCVHVPTTTSASGVPNPGLMQSHNGQSFSSAHSSLSILAMVQDGTQGTQDGAGLVQGLNKYGNVYDAARYYNSGEVGSDLSKVTVGTACYVSDVANRLMGWVTAKSTCPGDDQTS